MAGIYEWMPVVSAGADEAEALCKRYTWISPMDDRLHYHGECNGHNVRIWSVGPNHWVLTDLHSSITCMERKTVTLQFDVIHPTHCGTFERLCQTIDALVRLFSVGGACLLSVVIFLSAMQVVVSVLADDYWFVEMQPIGRADGARYDGPWTVLHPRRRVHSAFTMQDESDVDDTVIGFMALYGIDRVRGGRYQGTILSEAERKDLDYQVAIRQNRCTHCGTQGHGTAACPWRTRRWHDPASNFLCARCGSTRHGLESCRRTLPRIEEQPALAIFDEEEEEKEGQDD